MKNNYDSFLAEIYELEDEFWKEEYEDYRANLEEYNEEY